MSEKEIYIYEEVVGSLRSKYKLILYAAQFSHFE